jgi:tetratricopeptide (TPR) repeat protein
LVASEPQDQLVQNEPILVPTEEPPAETKSPKVETTILPEERNRIQTLSANADQALQQGDYLRAYQSLREALTYSPPVMATYILSRQLVQVLNEMGLYEESISVLEKVLNESPSLSTKKREEFTRQISYLEELIQQLQIENKRNLSWSLVPPCIHQKVIAHFRSLFASNNDQSTAIPFH